MKFILRDENDIYSCYIAKAQMIQCKHMISFKKLFNLRDIGKCWNRRNKITQSLNVSTYVNPRLKKYRNCKW